MPTYSLSEANWLIERIREQRGWTYERLAEELGVSDRFMRYFRTGERTSYPIYEKLTKLYKPEVPPKKKRIKVQVHAYVAEDDTPKFFKNLGKYMRRIPKGKIITITKRGIPRTIMQGEPVELTLEDFINFDRKEREIKENYAEWLVNSVEDIMARVGRWKRWIGLKGKSKIKLTIDEKSDIIEKEKESVERASRMLDRIEEEYRPVAFRIASEKAREMEEFDEQMEEICKFFIEREEYKRRPEVVEMTYTRAYLQDLGFSPEEIEKYRVVKKS